MQVLKFVLGMVVTIGISTIPMLAFMTIIALYIVIEDKYKEINQLEKQLERKRSC